MKSPKEHKKFSKFRDVFQRKSDHSISPVFVDSQSFDKKLGLLTVHWSRVPLWIELLLLLVEYIQLFAQTLLLMRLTCPTTDLDSSQSLKNLYFVAKIFLPGHFLDFENSLAISCLILSLIVLFAASKTIFGVIALKNINKKEVEGHWAIKAWKWINKIYTSIGYFPSASALASFIKALFDFVQVSAKVKIAAYVLIFGVLVLPESIFAMYHFATKSLCLPYQSHVAIKNPSIRILVTSHKFILVILQLALQENSINAFWVLVIINLTLTAGSLYIHFKSLLNYNATILSYKACLIVSFILFNLILFLRALVLSVSNRKFGVDSAIIIFALSLGPTLKTTQTYTERRIHGSLSLSLKTSNSLHLLLHKIFSIKSFQKSQKYLNITKKFEKFAQLVEQGLIKNISSILELPSSEISTGELNLHKVFLAYLQNLLAKFPQSSLIKLHLGYYYGRKLKMYRSAIKVLTELEHGSKGSIQISALLLKKNIELSMRSTHKQDQTSGLNLIQYIVRTVEIAKLKQKMLNQTTLQMRLCQEHQRDRPDISKLFNWAQKIYNQRCIINKKFHLLTENSPDYLIEPYLMMQNYEMLANHSFADFSKLNRVVLKNLQKYNKLFASKILQAENLYSPGNIFFVIQCQEESFGSIMHCSNSIKSVLDFDADQALGTTILSMIPQAFRSYYTQNITNSCEGKGSHILHNQFVSFISHNSGFMIEANVCMDIHPYMQQGIYVDILFRPTNTNLDYFILSEDGKITAFTERVGRQLGLIEFKKSNVKADIPIKCICAELDRVNKAFTMVASHFNESQPNNKNYEGDKKTMKQTDSLTDSAGAFKNLAGKIHKVRNSFRSPHLFKGTANFEEAIELYHTYSSQGKNLYLSPFDPSNRDPAALIGVIQGLNKYKCKIENKTFGNQLVRLCTLEAIIRSDDGDKKKNESPAVLRIENLMLTNPEKFRSFKIKPAASSRSSFSIQSSKRQSIDVSDSDSDRVFQTEIPTEIGGKTPLTTRYSAFRNSNVPLSSSRQALVGGDTTTRRSPRHIVVERNATTEQKTLIESTPRHLKNKKRPEFDERSIGSSQTQSASNMESISSAYSSALNSKYYPRYLKAVVALSILTIAVLLTVRTAFLIIIMNNHLTLNDRKDIVINAETKNYYLANAQQLARSLWNFKVGDPDVATDTLGSLEFLLQIAIDGLADANDAIRIATSNVNPKDRASLFLNDVSIYDNYFDSPDQTEMTVTNFQATEIIIAALDKIILDTSTDVTNSSYLYDFIYRNAVNDLLVTSQDTATIYFKTLNDLSRQDKNLEISRFVLSVVVAIGLSLIFTLVVLFQYRREVQMMEAFIRLRSLEVMTVYQRLEQLQSILQNEYYWKEETLVDQTYSYKTAFLKDHETKRKATAGAKSKEANSIGVARKYQFYLLKIFLAFVILLSLYIFTFTQGISVNKSLQGQLEQLNYSKRMMARIYLTFSSLVEVIATNDLAQLANQPASTTLETSFENMIDIQKTINSGYFEETSGDYDPQIQNLLFGQACDYLTGFSLANCLAVQNQGKKLNYAALLSNFQYYSAIIYNEYLASDKTQSSLHSLRLETFQIPFQNLIALNDLNKLISTQLIKNFEDCIISTNHKSIAYLSILISVFLVTIFLLWKTVYTKIRELDNQFKNVLRVFPPEHVLTNFLVKQYLKKTSNDVFSSVLNNI